MSFPYRAVALAGILIGLALAGCVDDPATVLDDPAPSSASHSFDGDNPDAGGISGFVLDDEGLPLLGAIVGVMELGAQVVTDSSGGFEFLNVPPGSYTILASRLGYDATAQPVEVEIQSVARITVTLALIVLEEVFYVTHGPLVGFLECGFGTPAWTDTCISTDFFGNLSGGRHRTYFHLDAEHWQSFVTDVWWEQTSAATGRGMQAFFRYDESSGSHWWCARDGESPLLFRYENPDNGIDSDCDSSGNQDPMPSTDLTLTVEGYPGFGGLSQQDPPVRFTFQQEFQVMVTIFYGDPGPPGFSARPDE